MAPCCPDVVERTAAGGRRYERHRPETTLLYRVVRERVATFVEQAEAGGAAVPRKRA